MTKTPSPRQIRVVWLLWFGVGANTLLLGAYRSQIQAMLWGLLILVGAWVLQLSIPWEADHA